MSNSLVVGPVSTSVRRTAARHLAGAVSLVVLFLAAVVLPRPSFAQSSLTLTGSVGPSQVSYIGTLTWTASASGGDPSTTRYSFFRRRPGGTWIPDVNAPTWQSSNVYSWNPTLSDVGVWETYIWVKDGNTSPTANTYGYAAGFNTMPIEVFGPPTAPGPTTVSCAYSVADDCWVTGDFTASVSAATGGLGSLNYEVCRSVDSAGGFAGCDVNLTLYGGTSFTVSGSQLPADGYRRAYYFLARDSAGAIGAWNTAIYVRVDRYPPFLSATNASATWFSNSTATISASDTGSGLQAVRYNWNSPLDGNCTTGTATWPGTTLTAPAGDNVLYLCAQDNTGRVAQWSGSYRVSPMSLTGTVSPSQASYLGTFTSTATASGGTPSTTRYAFFRRRPGGTWIPDVNAPTWQASNVWTWTPALADVGTWETYIWVKDGDTPANANTYGYAAGFNTMPIVVVGPPTVPGATTVSCAYSAVATGDCWVTGDFTASATASTGGTGSLVYQICRSNDSTGSGGCDVNLTLSGGTSILVSAANLPSDGYRRAYYFQAKDSAGALSGWNTPLYARVDRYAPVVSATNASSQWLTSSTATVSASDITGGAGANSGLLEVRYKWNSALDAACTTGTVTSSGATLTAPVGDNVLYLCARDNTLRVAQWSGAYRVSAPLSLTGTVSPAQGSYLGTFTYTASATGGDPTTTRYAFFRRPPGGTWIPDVNAPNWQAGNVFTWTPAQSDAGTWETYIWVKDGNTSPTANTYGYAAGFNTMPIVVVGPPSVPGATTVSCAYSTGDDCWVTGDFTASVASSTGGSGSLVYQICRSNDSAGGAAGCDVNLTLSGGTSILVSGTQLPADGYRRAYLFQAKDSAGALSGWNTPRYVRVDRYAPVVSATNASNVWFSSRTATLSASDSSGGAGANSGVQTVRYNWNTALDAGCTTGTATSSGTTLTVPGGDNLLYLCARDNTGRVGQWNGQYRVSAMSLTGTVSPAQGSYLGTFTYTAAASGGTPATTLYAFFRRPPGGTWIPDVNAPNWQASNVFTWRPAQADAGTWETYIWVKDGDTPASANTYGYAAGFNTLPIVVVGPPTVPGPTTVSCAWSAPSGDCWVTGDFTASVTASTGGTGSLTYQVCRSNDSAGGSAGCDANLTLSGGTSITVSAVDLPADGYRRAYYFQAKDSAGALSGWNTPVYVRVDRNAPAVSASNASDQWFTSLSATVAASDATGGAGANSGLLEVRYKWNSTLDAACTTGTVTSSGATLTAPGGDNVLYLCARDNTLRVAQWSGAYRVSAAMTLTGTVSPTQGSYLGTFTYTASAIGGDPATTRYAFFRRLPGGTWIPDVNAPNWQASNVFTWTPALADVGTWETYIWVKDGTTSPTANTYGYAAGFNTMPIVVVGPPTVPGPTTVSCAYSSPASGDCWVTGDFTASVTASTGGLGSLAYQICRSNDSTGFGGCDVNLTLSGGTSILVSATHLPADGYRRAYYFQAKDSAGALSGWNTPVYVRVDRNAPTVSATNASDQWFTSLTATVSAADDTGGAGSNSGLVEARSSWDSALDAACTSGAVVTSGTTLTVAGGDHVLYLCARDNTGRVGQWNGHYRVTTPLSLIVTPSPSHPSYGSPITWTATATGGDPATRQFALFRRRPGATWPDLTAPAWQSSNVLSWTPAAADLGDWEIYVWVKDGNTPPDANGYGYAAGFNPGPLTVVEPEAPDFTLALTPSTATIRTGESAQFTVAITAGPSFTGTAALSVSGLPASTSQTLDPAAIGAGDSATLTVTTTSNTPPSTSDITVTATAGDLTRTATVSLTVNAPSAPGAPVIDSITPQFFDGGGIQTITITGHNLQGGNVTIATEDPDPSNPTSRVFPTIGEIDMSIDGTSLEVEVDCSDPRVMDFYELVVDNGVGTAVSQAFRVVPAGPVVDLVTPNQPERGENHVYVLSLAGYHLRNTTVRSDPAGALEIFGLDTVDDTHINGLVRVPDGAPLGPVDIVVSDAFGHEARISIEVMTAGASQVATQKIRTQRIDPLTGKLLGGPSPDVLFQHFAVRQPETTEVTSRGLRFRATTFSLKKLRAKDFSFSLYFSYTVNLLRYDWSHAFVFDPVSGKIGDDILKALGLGQRVRFGAFVLAFHLEVDLTVAVYLSNNGFTWPTFCITIAVGLQIPGLDGFYEHWSFCGGGGSQPFRTGHTSSLNATGGSCAGVTQEGPPVDGLIYGVAEQHGCCDQPIDVTGEGLAFDHSWFATNFAVNTPAAGTTTPGQPCTCSINVAPPCVLVGKDKTFSAQGLPTGGTFLWRISKGGSRAAITSNPTSDSVTVHGNAASAAADDVGVEVVYTNGANTCTQAVDLSVVQLETPPLAFRSSGQADSDNSRSNIPIVGLPQLGPVTPNHPAGATGFFNNMQLKAKITPCDPNLRCQFDFKRMREGTLAQINPNGPVGYGPGDCPQGSCDDDATDTDEDLRVDGPPGCGIYAEDTPGINLHTTNGACNSNSRNVVGISCFNFNDWLLVDGVRATSDLLWHASSRIRCNGSVFQSDSDGAGNGIGQGHIDCSRQAALPLEAPAPGVFRSRATAPPPSRKGAMGLVARLDHADMAVRTAAFDLLLAKAKRGDLQDEARAKVVAALIERTAREAADGELQSTPLLAIQLLGELRATEAVPVLLRHLLAEFARPMTSDADQATPAAQALAKIGSSALEPLLDLAASGSDEEWRAAEQSLGLMHDKARLREAVTKRLAGKQADQQQERLRVLLGSIDR